MKTIQVCSVCQWPLPMCLRHTGLRTGTREIVTVEAAPVQARIKELRKRR